ncbi:MAG: FAD-dependent oxidoreductase [Clostridia bacterium]|nr:FAD-dependent oxidoreductase [Clostridia bacterium]
MKMSSRHYDVVVVGAGPGGLPAAIAASRLGAKVLLAEQHGYLGGNMAIGLPLLAYLDKDGNEVIKGIAQEFVDAMKPYKAVSDHKWCPLHDSLTIYNPEVFKVVAIQKCLEAGVELLLHCQVTDVNTDNGRIDSITLFGKGNKLEVTADVFIDATGDGDMAYMAGARYEKGQMNSGVLQPPTVMCTVTGIDSQKTIKYIEDNPEQMELAPTVEHYPGYDAAYFRSNPDYYTMVGMRKLVSQLKEKGEMPIDRDTLILIKTMFPNDMNLNCTRHLGIDGSDMFDLTKAEIEGQQQNLKLVEVLRKYLPGFENATLSNIFPSVGIRESRRFHGIRTLTEDMVMSGEIPPDSVGLGSYIIDIHDGGGKSTICKKVMPYGLPYGIGVSADIDNLMISGRCASMDAVALSSARVMPPLMALAQGLGVGAALAVKKGCRPAEADVGEIREILKKDGVMLEPSPEAKVLEFN